MKILPRILLLIASLGAAGCANTVYRYNLQHAYVAPAAGLSPEEAEQVIRVVTQKSLRMIISVTRDPDENKIVVYAANGDEGVMVYNLKKDNDGRWRIVDYDQGSALAL